MLRIVALVVVLGVLGRSQTAPATSLTEQLKQYVDQLQKTPGDDALRTRMIQLALTIDLRPDPPDAALEASGRGKFLLDNATSATDFAAGAAAFVQASLLAPWVPAYYFNQGVLLDKAQRYQDAIKAFRWYLVAEPAATDRAAVLVRIGGLQAGAEKAAQQAAVQAEAERQRVAAASEAERQRREAPEVRGYWVDGATGLMWKYDREYYRKVDTPTGRENTQNGYDAASLCRDLRLGGYSDWRLPEIGELEGIYDPTEKSNIKGGLTVNVPWYWSATRYGTREVWVFQFDTGRRNHLRQDLYYNVFARCVRP